VNDNENPTWLSYSCISTVKSFIVQALEGLNPYLALGDRKNTVTKKILFAIVCDLSLIFAGNALSLPVQKIKTQHGAPLG
jgi:hypothetical protein